MIEEPLTLSHKSLLYEPLRALHTPVSEYSFANLYQYMYHQFAAVMPSRYTAFNFEQDLGIESLRRSKASYSPEKIVKKYRVMVKPSAAR